MKLQTTLALRELRLHPLRTALVVAALILGLWGAGTPLLSWLILEPDLAENFQRTRPPHLVLRAEDFGGVDLTTFPEVEAAALRDFTIQRVEVSPDRWLPLYLYGVENFEGAAIARLQPQRGAAIPPAGTVLIERDGLRVASFTVGASPRIRVGGGLGTMPISGITFDASQAPATQDAFIYAYADRPTWAALSGQTSGQRMVLRLKNVKSASDVRRVGAQVTRRLADAGVVVSSMEVPRFQEHPHQWQLNSLLFLISSIGALAFAMAAVLVSQSMRAVLAGQVRQIGVLKALGATRAQVFRIAVLTATLMGLAAGVVGVPLAVVSGRLFAVLVAGKLNFDLLTPGVPPLALLALCMASVLLPSLFSLPTLLRGTGLPVLEALRDFRAKAPRTRSARSVLPPVWAMASRNVLRDRSRFLVTLLSTALGVAIFATAFNVREALWRMLDDVSRENSHDVQVVLSKPVSLEAALAPFAGLPNVRKVEAWSGGQGEVQSRVLSTKEGVGVVALPRGTALFHPRLVEGRWLEPSAELEVVLNQQGWLAYGKPPLGSRFEVTLRGKPAQVHFVGLAQQFEKAKLYVDQVAFDAQFNPDHAVSTLLFVAERNQYAEVLALEGALEQVVAKSKLPVLFVMSHAERVHIVAEHLNIILMALLLLSFLVLTVSAIGNASAVGVEVLQRTRELGVLRAMGATPVAITRLLRLEGLLISAAGIALGLLLAAPLTPVATAFFGNLMLGEGARLEPAFSGLGLAVTLIATFGFGWLASWLPARSALRVPTHQALAHRA